MLFPLKAKLVDHYAASKRPQPERIGLLAILQAVCVTLAAFKTPLINASTPVIECLGDAGSATLAQRKTPDREGGEQAFLTHHGDGYWPRRRSCADPSDVGTR